MENQKIKSFDLKAIDTTLSGVFKNAIIDLNLPENDSIKIKEGLRCIEEELLILKNKIISEMNDYNSDPDLTSQLFVKYDELIILRNEI